MQRAYKRIIENHIEKMDLSTLRIDKGALEPLITEIFKEKCQVYIFSEEGKSNFNVEIHFDDCNFYELKFSDDDTKENVINNILQNLVLERFSNKQNPDINWNNVRFVSEK